MFSADLIRVPFSRFNMCPFSPVRHLIPALPWSYSPSSYVKDKPGYFAANRISLQRLLPLVMNTAELNSNSGLARMPVSFSCIVQAQFQTNSAMMI